MPIILESPSASGGGSGTVTSVTAADTSIVIAGTAVAPTVATATLDVIAADHPAAANWSNNSKKITSLANGAAAQDAAAFGQIPTALPPNGAAGGDLAGSYPSPTVAANAVTVAKLASAVTLDAIATAYATAADVSLNTHKITNLTNGSAVQDAAAFGQLSGLAYGIGVFGDGSDGTVTFDGTTVILGLTPASNVYTLTRDIFLAAGTINNGVSIVPGGFRIYCQGTLTNNGTIRSNGVASTTATGANGVLNVATSSFLSTSVTVGTTGGNGGSAAVGSNGGAQNASINALGGVGGTGGTAGANAGGAGGTLTAPTAAKGTLRAVPQASAGLLILSGTTAGAVQLVGGGTGGGGGGGSGSGGGGGGGGGVMFVSARIFAGTGAIQARGGNGANGQSGNSGGGGGGGGGLVLVVSQSVSAGAISGQTIDANGGTKGAPIGTGTNNATDGSVGTVILVAN